MKPHLEIPVYKCLPHFSFHVGKLNDSFHPQVQPAYDTCAALNCGFLPFHTAIAKTYTKLIKDITWAGDEFSPIWLQGVVHDTAKQNETTTSLVAVIEYFTPYTTVDGSHTTLKVALGNDVAANLILGIATIKAAGLNLDVQDDVITSSVLDNFGPTKVVFKNTARGLPSNIPKDEKEGNLPLHFKQIYKKACKIEEAADIKSSIIGEALHTDVASEKTNTNSNMEKKEVKGILKSPSLKNIKVDYIDDSIIGFF